MPYGRPLWTVKGYKLLKRGIGVAGNGRGRAGAGGQKHGGQILDLKSPGGGKLVRRAMELSRRESGRIDLKARARKNYLAGRQRRCDRYKEIPEAERSDWMNEFIEKYDGSTAVKDYINWAEYGVR